MKKYIVYDTCSINTFTPNEKNTDINYWKDQQHFMSSYLIYEGCDRLIGNLDFPSIIDDNDCKIIILDTNQINKLRKILYSLYSFKKEYDEKRYKFYDFRNKAKCEALYNWIESINKIANINVLVSTYDFSPYDDVLFDWLKKIYNKISNIPSDKYILIKIRNGITNEKK